MLDLLATFFEILAEILKILATFSKILATFRNLLANEKIRSWNTRQQNGKIIR